MEEILRIALEIIRLLTGQEDVVVRRSGDRIVIHPAPHTPRKQDKEQILDLTHKMLELLAGERRMNVYKDVTQEGPRAVGSSLADEPDVTLRIPELFPGRPENVLSEKQEKCSGNITVRLTSSTTGILRDGDRSVEHARVKIEPDNDHMAPMYDPEDLSSLHIKEESVSGDEGAVTSPADKDTTICITECSLSGEGTEYVSSNIKEEPSSGGEEILRDAAMYSPPYHIIKIKSVSGEHVQRRDTDVTTRQSHTLSTCQIVEPSADSMHCCTSSGLSGHQTAHTDKKPLTCLERGRCTSSAAAPLLHHRIHKGETPFVCSDCGQKFVFKSHLVRHQIKHTAEKPFSLECSKAAIAMHQRLHTGNAAYTCKECGKCFAQKNHLQQHLNSHTEEKPYACPECGKRFMQKGNLKQHLSVHLPKKKETFCCSECGKCYKRRADFRWHMLIHLGEK